MSENNKLRVLLCIGINQNFFDSTPEEGLQVWAAFGEMWNNIHDLEGVEVFGNMDDDRGMVGASDNWPWTTYLLADFPNIETVHAACNFFRTTVVGEGPYKLWKYCKVEARIGRELIIQR